MLNYLSVLCCLFCLLVCAYVRVCVCGFLSTCASLFFARFVLFLCHFVVYSMFFYTFYFMGGLFACICRPIEF